jgi:hypothetical protein
MNKIYTEPYDETQKKIILIVDNDKEIPSELKDISPDFLLELLTITKKVWNIAIEVKDRNDNNTYENMYYELLDEKEKELEGGYNIKMKNIKEEYNKKIDDFLRKVKQNETEIERYKNDIDRQKTEYEKTISIERTMKRTLENTLQEKDNAMKAFELNINNLIQKAMDTTNKRHVEEMERNICLFNKEKARFEQTIKKLEDTIHDKESTMKALELNINNLVQKSIEMTDKKHLLEIERIMNQYSKEKSRFENNIQKLEDMLQSEKATYQSLLREEKTRHEMLKKEEIVRLEASNKILIENMKSLYMSDKEKIEKELISAQEKINDLQESIRIGQASVVKGVVGQNDFFELIKEYTLWTGIEDTSKTSHAADLRGYIDKVETMFEVKNYTSDVPTKEVVKMIRDLETHSNISYGVFVSMNTGIVGKKKAIEFQWTAHGQLCMFVSNLLKHDMDLVFNYISQCASIAQRFFTLCNSEEKNEIEAYKDKLLQVKTVITKQISEISEMITAMAHHKKLHMDNLNKHYTEYKLMLEKMKISCNEVVDIVVGTVEPMLEEVNVDVQPNVDVATVANIVEKKKRKKKSDP